MRLRGYGSYLKFYGENASLLTVDELGVLHALSPSASLFREFQVNS